MKMNNSNQHFFSRFVNLTSLRGVSTLAIPSESDELENESYRHGVASGVPRSSSEHAGKHSLYEAEQRINQQASHSV